MFRTDGMELLPINDCPTADCTKSEWISLDTDDYTGDHERFELVDFDFQTSKITDFLFQ